ncbi:hypothetical protein Glove_87g177 [Diversispora epigaea]|uniref:TLDc domain-containing protein n=1 Tax=Diversispora epigaea TaxID=1348612 RepID=A0A397JFP9_9GLOM|nr:hypothetical protein Glove_87g177 [Diversispora epigaea]
MFLLKIISHPELTSTPELPSRENEPFSTIINNEHVAELSSWIDRKSNIYSLANIPYEFQLILHLKIFWNLCHGHGDTILVAKVAGTDEIIGGYNPLPWDKNIFDPKFGGFEFVLKSDVNNVSVEQSFLMKGKQTLAEVRKLQALQLGFPKQHLQHSTALFTLEQNDTYSSVSGNIRLLCPLPPSLQHSSMGEQVMVSVARGVQVTVVDFMKPLQGTHILSKGVLRELVLFREENNTELSQELFQELSTETTSARGYRPSFDESMKSLQMVCESCRRFEGDIFCSILWLSIPFKPVYTLLIDDDNQGVFSADSLRKFFEGWCRKGGGNKKMIVRHSRLFILNSLLYCGEVNW